MFTKHFIFAVGFCLASAGGALADETTQKIAHAHKTTEHGGGIFHKFQLETTIGKNNHGKTLQGWDLDGWIGTDENKLWLKSEGERANTHFEALEMWALYSRNVSTFWDAQVGVRYDYKPKSTAYLAFGVHGLAQYYFETEAYVFISQHGDITARLRQENELLLTQKLILQLYAELNFSAQKVERQELGAGLTDGNIGLQTRYEVSRKFAPFVDVHYGRKFGVTSSIARANGEHKDEVVGAVGVRVMF